MSNPGQARPKPKHASMNQFAVIDNCLQIAGMPLPELAAQMGEQPFYAYDSSVIDAQIAKLRKALPADIHLHYAMKANPMPEVAGLHAVIARLLKRAKSFSEW